MKEARKTANKRRQVIFFIISLFCVLFITVLSRVPTLSRVTHLVPLWSYTSAGHCEQILLNIALFVPLGFFLVSVFSSSKRPVLWPILSALLASVAVEVTQFLTYRGMLDVDDLISNCCGAAVGLLIYKVVEKHGGDKENKRVGSTMITAALIGCIMVAVPAAKSNISTRIVLLVFLKKTNVAATYFLFLIQSISLSSLSIRLHYNSQSDHSLYHSLRNLSTLRKLSFLASSHSFGYFFSAGNICFRANLAYPVILSRPSESA